MRGREECVRGVEQVANVFVARAYVVGGRGRIRVGRSDDGMRVGWQNEQHSTVARRQEGQRTEVPDALTLNGDVHAFTASHRRPRRLVQPTELVAPWSGGVHDDGRMYLHVVSVGRVVHRRADDAPVLGDQRGDGRV